MEAMPAVMTKKTIGRRTAEDPTFSSAQSMILSTVPFSCAVAEEVGDPGQQDHDGQRELRNDLFDGHICQEQAGSGGADEHEHADLHTPDRADCEQGDEDQQRNDLYEHNFPFRLKFR